MRISDWSSDVCSSDLSDDDVSSSSDRDQRLQIIIEAYIALLAAGQPQQQAGIDIPSETFRMADAIRARGVQRALATSAARGALGDPRSEERRVGKECVGTC